MSVKNFKRLLISIPKCIELNCIELNYGSPPGTQTQYIIIFGLKCLVSKKILNKNFLKILDFYCFKL